ncbi:unnamed protein product [Paramecium octaurelia]|uniref:Uncharacterized protein n=1 Tax=Paramecium octaurelia TaxID=43137 RepID=A0A8S1WCS0_PAROT|nr:unnamed protein product [Paramecium octaurelia]
MLILSTQMDGIVQIVTVIFIVVMGVIILGNMILLHLMVLLLVEYFQIQRIILISQWNYSCYSKIIKISIDIQVIIMLLFLAQTIIIEMIFLLPLKATHVEEQQRYLELFNIEDQLFGHGQITIGQEDLYHSHQVSLNVSMIALGAQRISKYFAQMKYITISNGWTFSSNYFQDFNCGGCQYLQFQQIKYQTWLPLHQDVLINFFIYDPITIIVDYSCGIKTLSTSGDQQIEVLIENHCDPILSLKITTLPTSNYCFLRDFEVFYTQPEKQIVNKLNEGCLEYIDDKCLICQEGWIEDKFLENCHPICGDGMIQDQYCHISVSQTQAEIVVSKLNEGCQMQIDNSCLNCKEGWIKDDFLDNCHPFCGDGIIQGQEECDDANLISNDSCYQCKYSCINFCKTCVFGICFECVF